MALPSNNRDQDPKIEKYKNALEENPDSRYFAPLADALRKAGDLEEAIKTAEDGVKRNPRYESGVLVLAKIYLDSEKYEQALEQFQIVTRLNPENVNAQKAIAEIYDKLGYHKEAMQAYNTVTILDPRDQRAKERLELLEATAPEKGQKEELISSSPPAEKHIGKVPKEEEIREESSEEQKAEEKVEHEKPQDEDEKTVELSALDEKEEKDEVADDDFFPGPVPARESAETGKEENEKGPNLDNVVISEPGKGESMPLFSAGEPTSSTEVDNRSPESLYEENEESPESENASQEQAESIIQEGKEDKVQGPSQDREENVLDDFFAEAKPQRISLLGSDEASDESSPFGPVSKPRFQVTIEKSKGGKMFWNQGHYQEALKIIARNLWEAPYDQDLREEFLKVCRAMDRSPEAVLDEVIVIEDEKRIQAQESQDAEEGGHYKATPQNEESKVQEEEPDEEYLESKQKIKTLKSYLDRIRQDKEKMP